IGEKQGEIAAKPVSEEASQKDPVIDTKPDIFQTTQEDGIIIVNYPNINAKKEKDSHINDTLDALNEVTPTAIEALERLFGKVPDQNKPKGSNYGRLAQDFKFPSQKPPKNNPSNINNDVTASSSKNSGDNKEVDQDDLDKKERARRRKSNLNPFAPEFTFTSNPVVDTNKSSDTSEQKHDDDRKKKNVKKEKLNHEMNGDMEISYQNQKKKRRSSQQLIASETAGPYSGYTPNGYDHNAYYLNGHTPFLPNHAEGTTVPNWEELQAKITEEVANKIVSELQKGVDTITTLSLEVKNTLTEHLSEDSNINGKKNDEETTLQKFQDQILQELRNNHQEMRTKYDKLIHKHEEMQNHHLDQVSSLQTIQDGDIQNSISQRYAELQTMHKDLQTDLKNGLKEILDRQQQLSNEIKDSQSLQNRINELHSENLRLADENRINKMQFDDRKRQQDALISELRTELNHFKDKASRADTTIRSLDTQKTGLEGINETLENQMRNLENKMRDQQNSYDALYVENNTLQARILRIDGELDESKRQYQELENKRVMEESSSKIKEENLRKKLQDADQELHKLRADQRRLKELESEIKALKSNESVQLRSNDQLKKRVEELESSRFELQQNKQKELSELRDSKNAVEDQLLDLSNRNKTLEDENKELQNKVNDLQHTCSKMKEYEANMSELKKVRDELENVNQRIKSMDEITLEYNKKVEELEGLRLEVEKLKYAERDLEFSRINLKEVSSRLEALEAENKKLIENNRSQKSASAASNAYSYGPKMNGVIEDRMIIRDHQPLYNNQPNGNLEQAHYNSRMKPFNEFSSQQTYSQSPANGGINLTTQSMPHMINGASQQQQPSQHQAFIPQTQNPPIQYLSNGSLSQPQTQPQLQALFPSSQVHQQSTPIRSNTPVPSQKMPQKQDQLQQHTPIPSQKMPQKQDQLQQSPLPSQHTQPNQEHSTVKQESRTHSRQGSRSNNIGGKKRNQNSKRKDRNRRNSTTETSKWAGELTNKPFWNNEI
ncbi:2516_t:CDS:2, partial [Gigaspora margarita]